jgi:hypothetical protein
MFTIGYLLFSILLLLALGAVIAFSYFVIRPVQTRWAIGKARKMVATRDIRNKWQLRNVYRMLATARNDLEAADLWYKLKEIQEINENWAE